MIHTLTCADVRGFYEELGIMLPHHSGENVCVACFASPDLHRRQDRKPSLSINIHNGSWNCHGCGARGGAYDAAIARRLSPRSAMNLLRRHEFEPADRGGQAHSVASTSQTGRLPPNQIRPSLELTESDISIWKRSLARQPHLINRLERARAWRRETMLELELGIDHGHITIPVRTAVGSLAGLLRYWPWAAHRTVKLLAVQGSHRQLHPHPALEPSPSVLLVEGEPDMIAARSHGLPAIALPGVGSWRSDWAQLLAGRQVTIIMDADTPGRRAAQQIHADLDDIAHPHIIDLAPERHDGYDLTDWLGEQIGRKIGETPDNITQRLFGGRHHDDIGPS